MPNRRKKKKPCTIHQWRYRGLFPIGKRKFHKWICRVCKEPKLTEESRGNYL